MRAVRWTLASGSLLTLRFGRRRVALFPLWPVVYLLATFAVVIATLFALEWKVLPELERRGEMVTPNWQKHRELVLAQRYVAVPPASPDPVWRSEAFPVTPQRTKARRILVLGDSFAYGTALVNINDVWWRQLQRELERRGYNDVEVIAAAREGAPTARELDFARAVVPVYKPDLLIYGYVTNDADEGFLSQVPPVREPRTPYFNAAMAFVEPALPILANHLRELRQAKVEDRARSRGWYQYDDWELMILSPANLARYEKTLREVKRFQDEQHLPGLFVALPNGTDARYFAPRYRPIEPLFARVGLDFYNDFPDFVRKYPTLKKMQFQAMPNDGHPGPLSTRFHAVRIADYLEQRYAAALGPKSAPRSAHPIHFNDWLPATIETDRSEEARGVFAFDYPLEDGTMPFMPDGGPFVQLSLEHPVALREIRAEGSGLVSCDIGYTALHADGYDDGRLKGYSAGRCTLAVTGPGAGAVNSIHFRATLRETLTTPRVAGRERIVLKGPFQAATGARWAIALPPNLAGVSDMEELPSRSTLQLFEDGKALGPAHSLHDQIETVGHGMYSHWRSFLFFSASDNSDPNKNGRRYEIDVEKITSRPRHVRLVLIPADAKR